MYLFHLAERLGKTVRELESGMDMRELSEWIAFDRLRNEPEEEQPSLQQVARPEDIDQEELARNIKAVLGAKKRKTG